MSRTNASLIERAAEVYDFGAALRERARPAAVDGSKANTRAEHPELVAQSPEHPELVEGLPSSLHREEERAGLRQAQPVRVVDRALHAPAAHPRFEPLREVEPARTLLQGEIDRQRLIDEGFVVPDAPVGAIAEEFRLVKRQLLLRKSPEAAGPKDRMILVCSAQPNEGKTFCSVNLALSLASERDNEVLLVDADMAKPEVMSMLGLAVDGYTGAGLIDAVADPALDVESLIIATNIPKLSVLPAGRATPNDTELLSSARAGELLQGLAASNARRIVILDSAPALAASPAGVLAHHVGRVLMIVRADRTSESEVRDSVALLDGCDDIVLLLNGTTFFGTNRTYGSYYGADA